MAYSGSVLSGSTHGRPISVAATGTPGTLIHTAGLGAGSGQFDAIWLWASNVSNADVALTVEWGGVSDPGDHLVHSLVLPKNSPPLAIATGQRLRNGLAVRAFAGTGGAIIISGYADLAV